jgi:hypothetical protein
MSFGCGSFDAGFFNAGSFNSDSFKPGRVAREFPGAAVLCRVATRCFEAVDELGFPADKLRPIGASVVRTVNVVARSLPATSSPSPHAMSAFQWLETKLVSSSQTPKPELNVVRSIRVNSSAERSSVSGNRSVRLNRQAGLRK